MPKDEEQLVHHRYPEQPPRARDSCTSSVLEEAPLQTAPVHHRWCEHHRNIAAYLFSLSAVSGSVLLQLASMAELAAPLAKL